MNYTPIVVSPPASEHPKRRAWVLFIEDSRGDADLYSEALARDELNVRAVSGGEQGIRAAQELGPAAVVVDLGLPDMDGWEVIRRLRHGTSPMDVPIVVLTGMNLPNGADRARRAGCSDYLRKPCTPDALLAAIRSAIRRGPPPS